MFPLRGNWGLLFSGHWDRSFSARGPGRKNAASKAAGIGRLLPAELHPPFFFVLPKKNAPCTVEEKGAFYPK